MQFSLSISQPSEWASGPSSVSDPLMFFSAAIEQGCIRLRD